MCNIFDAKFCEKLKAALPRSALDRATGLTFSDSFKNKIFNICTLPYFQVCCSNSFVDKFDVLQLAAICEEAMK